MHLQASRRPLILLVLLMACTAIAFAPVIGCSFLPWDDQETVAKNPSLNPVTFDKIARYFHHEAGDLYMPITCTAWGVVAAAAPRLPADADGVTLNPAWFHGLNLLLHCVSCGLVFFIIRRLVQSDWPAFLGAACYALHPAMVEPVAWVSGTKDVLCGTFSLAATVAYVLPAEPSRLALRRTCYVAAIVFAALAMMSKSSAVCLPGVLFVIARFGLQKSFRRSMREAVPFVLLAVPIVAVGRWMQPAAGIVVPLWARPFVAGDAIWFYIRKTVWPGTLIVDYGRNPLTVIQAGATMYFTTAATLVLLGLGWLSRRRFPGLIAGLGVFVAALTPTLGFFPFEFQRYSTVSDHYLYLAMLGPAMIVAFALRRCDSRFAFAAIAMTALALGIRTHQQIQYWHDTKAFREHIAFINPASPVGLRMVARQALVDGDLATALRDYELVVTTRPDDAESQYNFANLLMRTNTRLGEAVAHYDAAMVGMADNPLVPNNRGIALARLGRSAEAEASFREAIRRDSAFVDGHANLGQILAVQGKLPAAADEFRAALALDPSNQSASQGLQQITQSP